MLFKRLFCKHKDELCEKIDTSTPFRPISGRQTYLRCVKCGRVKKHRFMTWEEIDMWGE